MKQCIFSLILCLYIGSCGQQAHKDESVSAAAQEVQAARIYLKDVLRNMSKSAFPEKLWKAGSSDGMPSPVGGIVERVTLPVAGKESIMLMRSSLDQEALPAEASPPIGESFRTYAMDALGRLHQDASVIVEGDWNTRRRVNGRFEYGLDWSRREAPPRNEVYTAKDGKVALTETKTYLTQDETREKWFELGEEKYKEWAKTAMASAEGLEPYEPERSWITLAELIRSKEPKWKEGYPPAGRDAMIELQQSTPEITLDDLKTWLESGNP